MPGPNSAPNGRGKLVNNHSVRYDATKRERIATGKTAVVNGNAPRWNDKQANA